MVLLPSILKSMEKLKFDGTVIKIDVVSDKKKINGDGGGGGSGDKLDSNPNKIVVTVASSSEPGTFNEEDRSRQPSLFSVVREITHLFSYNGGDGQLGLYGSFGYDLAFQFEPITLKQIRENSQRDLLLYLPDEILVVDQDKREKYSPRNNSNNSPGNYNNNNSSPFNNNNNNNNRKKLKIILNKMIGFMYLYVYHMVENYNIKIFITNL